MTKRPQPQKEVPLRALGLSLAPLLLPVLGSLAFPEPMEGAGQLLWLVGLVPVILLSYYRGWRGAATALTLGMGVIISTQITALLLDHPIPDTLPWVVLAYLATGLGLGWVTELLHREREGVEDLALTDILTRLPNRRHARLFLETEFGAAQRGHLLAVALFDLDGFKAFNDLHGHKAGDDALRRFAEILDSTTRRMNLSARFGGEEFLTVLAGSDEEGAVTFANRVREALNTTQLPQGKLTVSAGVAAYHPSMRSPDELIAAADLALYRAKREGRNRVRVFGRPQPDGAPEFLPLDRGREARELAYASKGTGEATQGPAEEFDGSPPSRDGSVPRDSGPKRILPGESLRLDGGSGRYPRTDDEIGRSPPASELLPTELSRFGEDRRVLVVEDDSGIRRLIDSFLSREGFSVVTAADANTAIEALDEEFDVLITDVRLPGASGNELVAILKARWPATQVIVMTGAREAHIAAEALNAGADRYLFKPFGMHELQAHLSDALVRRDRTLTDRKERRLLSVEAEMRGEEAREAILKGARALVRAVEVRDAYTRGHSDRVADYATTIARAAGEHASDLDLDTLRLACELHDVGKIGISDAILNKEGPLTPEEFVQVQKHPATGRRILEPLLGDELILAVTTWHHERWDGKGYPDGLSGSSIPYPARIVAIADALDAMTSTRAYRAALPWETAVEQIVERGGSQFDPELIAPFRMALPELESLAAGARTLFSEE